MGDRPTHAETIHPYVVELPLWLLWRAAHGAHAAWAHLLDAADAVRAADPSLRRLTLIAAVSLAVLVTALILSLLLR